MAGTFISGAGVSAYVDPISRIEGHLGVNLHVTSGKIDEANVHGNLWRGFENFLIGREPNDAITFTQRICGVCPVPHGMTATFNVESVIGYNQKFQTWATGQQQLNAAGTAPEAVPANMGVPVKALHMRNLVLGAEFLMSSLTHFYHLAAPSYVQGPNVPPWTPYFGDNHYHPLLRSNGHGINAAGGSGATLPLNGANGFSGDLWSAVIKQYVKALRIRRLTFEAGAMFAGRMPMTSGLIAGGTGFDKNEPIATRLTKYASLMGEIAQFVATEYVPTVLALGALYPNYDNALNAAVTDTTTPNLWTMASPDNVTGTTAANSGYGAGVGNFLAWGGFPQINGTLALSRGFKLNGALTATPISVADVYANLRENIGHSRYIASQTKDNAGVTLTGSFTDPATENRTQPDRSTASKYSWLKAPRWNGNAMEVGPFARMVVMGFIDAYGHGTYASSVPGIGNYLKQGGAAYTTGPATGLNPALIGPDIAVALVVSGLATVYNGATNALITDSTTIGGLGKTAIVTAYSLPTTEIRGIIFTWVAALSGGLSTMDRLRARAIESLVLCQSILGPITGATVAGGVTFANTGWVNQLSLATGDTYRHIAVPRRDSTGAVIVKSGFGAVEAPRGALMHMCTITDGKISQYQCIVPTTWNGSPMDAAGNRGPIEQAMIGTAYHTGVGWDAAYTLQAGGTGAASSGVEALRVAQSFDPCIACAVH